MGIEARKLKSELATSGKNKGNGNEKGKGKRVGKGEGQFWQFFLVNSYQMFLF